MHFRAFLILLLALASAAPAAPVSVKEIEFLVRQQFSEEEIVREVAQRRLLAPLDEAGAALLAKSGATPSLLARLKAPTMVASPEESRSQLQRQIAQEALAKKAATEEARVAAELARNAHHQQPEPITFRGITPRQMLEGKLVRLDGDALKAYDTKELEKVRTYALYFSAAWCGPCRKFTPQLVEAYRALKAKHPDFEVIFVSSDRDEFNMGEYMRSHKMPWPAVRFGAAHEWIKQLASSYVPRLVALSDSGGQITLPGVSGSQPSAAQVLHGLTAFLDQAPLR